MSRRPLLTGALGAGALAVAAFLCLGWKDPLFCWNDDYEISILPVLADVARAWREGSWPLLSPFSWGCANLAGEYQYGTFSVFVNAVVAAVFAFDPAYPTATAAISGAHLFALAMGAFLLGKRRGLSHPLATLVALTGALNGWVVCWGATDWFGALAALAWLPWAWWALEVSVDETEPRWRWLLPAPFIYLLIAGGFPYTVLTLAAVTAWLAVRERRLRALAPLAVGWMLGLGLSAAAWLSLLSYMVGSGRAQAEGVNHHAWVVPLSALPGLILPCWVTNWPDFFEQLNPHAAIELTGALVPLAALAAGRRRLGRTARWDLALAAAVLGQCLLPSAGVFRWSFRSLPFFHLALGLAGAQALQALQGRRWRDNPGCWALAATVLAWIALPAMRVGGGRAAGTFNLPLASLALAGTWIAVERTNWPTATLRGWLRTALALGFIMASYLCLPLNPGVPRYPFTGNLAKPEPLSVDRLYLSLYEAPELSYHGKKVPDGFGAILRPGSTGMFAGVHLINGYSPVHPAGVGRRLGMGTHGQIPPERAADLLGHGDLLDRLGVDGLIVSRGFPAPPVTGWPRVFESDEGAVYQRPGAPLGNVQVWSSAAQVREIANSRNGADADVVARDDQPIVLTFRRPFLPGYRATLNGRSIPVTSYEGLMPAVELPAGSSGRVELRYRPPAVLWGAAIAAASALSMLWFATWPRLRVRWRSA